MHTKAEFTPKMQTNVHSLRTLEPLSWRRFAGTIADVWSIRGKAGAGGFYVSPDPRIVIMLDDDIPAHSLTTKKDADEKRGVGAFYIPAGVPLWSRLETAQDFSHIDFHFETSALHARLGAAGINGDLTKPRFIGSNDVLATIGRMAAKEVRQPSRGDMMLDGLFRAALGEIFTTATDVVAPAPGNLTPHKLSALKRFLQENMTRQVTVAEMATVAGLSPSWFAHCFSTQHGETPQRWQARLRLETACEMVAETSMSFAEIAHATGFSDQAHLSRVFRAKYGQPPSRWRRERFPKPYSKRNSPVQDII
ncbi:AraC family transcriptional regulator [Agrobacterium sp.]|uniref:AraC family transcriptional regulator n=1 Tax=Agrobacterium sp. TaxID=361 RepID=UPI0028ACEE49